MKVKIEDLTFDCIIGILPFEREKEQRVIINCSFSYNFINSEFIDYSKVALDIENLMKKNKFELIEDALLNLKKCLKDKYSIKKLNITIKKPDILSNCKVSVSL
ncbi:dihydroneopterin aldolase [Arcobacter sp. KX21116]|uniref:dihydroneopterin aldolase n=1 Tax=Arcobacter iocasae TaxID=2906515 RepID=UPI0035D528C6